jgi:predicted exporter
MRWADEAGGRRFLLVGVRSGVAVPAGSTLLPMSPRHHYDALLTGLSRELGWLFLAGLVAMALYLGFLQRRAARVLYVFAPLFPCALAFAAYARLTGATLNIVHFMGFSLVIALALDYTAVAVSSDHRPVELSKVLLTGVSTLATFGVLVVARHPVMRDLGTTVAIGSGVSLLLALFVRLPARLEDGA